MRRLSHSGITLALLVLSLVLPLTGYLLFSTALQLNAPLRPPIVQSSPLHEQWLALAAFFGVKTAYTLLTLWLLWRLRGRNGEDVASLWWALAAFFVGEAFCFINVMWFEDLSLLLEWLHGTGMVVFLAGATYAVLRMFDLRVLHLERNHACALAEVCGSCTRLQGACRLPRLFIALNLGAAIVALLPLCWDLRQESYITPILGRPHVYAHPVVIQFFEWRFLPWAAVVLLLAALVRVVCWELLPQRLSMLLFAAGCGAAGFSLLRLLMAGVFFDHQIWFAVWEEVTELVMIVGIAWLVQVFPGWARQPAASAVRRVPVAEVSS